MASYGRLAAAELALTITATGSLIGHRVSRAVRCGAGVCLLAFALRLNLDFVRYWRATDGAKMKGIRTNRNELISDFDPFELDKLVMIVSPVVGVVLWLTEAPVIWWVGALAWIGLWMLQREAKVRAWVTHYHEERIVELERQVQGLKARLSQYQR